jgi:hypothetical protein
MNKNHSNFELQLAWATQNGAYLNPKIERKECHGIAGMYTSESIAQGETLATIPKSLLVSVDKLAMPSNTSLTAKQVYASTKHLEQFKADTNSGQAIAMLESMDANKSTSTYFSTVKELKILNELSPTLTREIASQNAETDQLVNALHNFDPSSSKEDYLVATLNFKSRAIGKNGFVPIAECFNHSCTKGHYFDSLGDTVTLQARTEYQAGTQVFMSYGELDMFSHAVNYNYFDPSDTHFIGLPKRFEFSISDATQQSIAMRLEKHYPLAAFKKGLLTHYRINDTGALFTETAPNEALQKLSLIATNDEAGRKSFLKSLLTQLKRDNLSQNYSARYVPSRIKRFYHMLAKERDMVEANLAYADKL